MSPWPHAIPARSVAHPQPFTPFLPSSVFFSLKLGFYSHQAVARTAGSILIRLSDSLVLPMISGDYAESLEGYLATSVTLYQDKLQQKNISMGKTVHFVHPVPQMTSWRSSSGLIMCLVLEPLKQAVQNFRTASDRLDKIVTETDFYQEKWEAVLATLTPFAGSLPPVNPNLLLLFLLLSYL